MGAWSLLDCLSIDRDDGLMIQEMLDVLDWLGPALRFNN